MAFLGNHRPLRILDIGAGSGFFARQLLLQTDAESALCVDIGYDADSSIYVGGKSLRFVRECNTWNADLALFMDVIEHVPDDSAFLKTYVDRLESGTLVLISVPAFQWLFSSHDHFLGHYRRYNQQQLEGVLNTAGLSLIRASFFFALIFPVAATVRLFERIARRNAEPRSSLRQQGVFLNRLLIAIHQTELRFMRFNRYFGLTLFALARKP